MHITDYDAWTEEALDEAYKNDSEGLFNLAPEEFSNGSVRVNRNRGKPPYIVDVKIGNKLLHKNGYADEIVDGLNKLRNLYINSFGENK